MNGPSPTCTPNIKSPKLVPDPIIVYSSDCPTAMRKVLTLLKAGFFLQLKSFKISVIMSGLSRKTSFKGFKYAFA
jgi:hypothetical protein